MVEAGGSVGGCSFVTLATMKESESNRLTRGEEGSLGGVTSSQREADGEAEAGGGSSYWSPSLNAELLSGPEGNPEKMEEKQFFVLYFNTINLIF